jgi:hypothetical protein
MKHFTSVLLALAISASAAQATEQKHPIVSAVTPSEHAPDASAKEPIPDPFMNFIPPADGEPLAPLKCMKASEFALAVKTHDGSPVVKMSLRQAMFYRGYYAAMPFTADGYPVGDDVVYAVRAAKDSDAIQGTVGFTLGEYMVCNVLPVTQKLLNILFKIESDRGGS